MLVTINVLCSVCPAQQKVGLCCLVSVSLSAATNAAGWGPEKQGPGA